MKKSLFVLMAVALSATAMAQSSIELKNDHPEFGANGPARLVNESVQNNIYHAPQYMPNYPTAATIWPRVVTVDNCTKFLNEPNSVRCDGYNWNPSMGRAEYLFVTTKSVAVPPPPVVVEVIKEVPGPERIILQEVPPKKKRE